MQIHFLEKAALLSENDLELWYRYLRKYITKYSNKISNNLLEYLSNSKYLTNIQKEHLQKMVQNHTVENQKVCFLSHKRNSKFEFNNLQAQELIIQDNAFELLNTELAKRDLHLKIICVGGFVLQTLGIRSTIDVDAFYQTNSQIEQAIKRVGNVLNINNEEELWLNNSVQNLNTKPIQRYCVKYAEYSNLVVYMVIPEYLIGMKLEANRENDHQDIVALIAKLGLTEPIQLYKELCNMGFKPDIGDLLIAFSQVLGTKWWKQYVTEHWDIIGNLE